MSAPIYIVEALLMAENGLVSDICGRRYRYGDIQPISDGIVNKCGVIASKSSNIHAQVVACVHEICSPWLANVDDKSIARKIAYFI